MRPEGHTQAPFPAAGSRVYGSDMIIWSYKLEPLDPSAKDGSTAVETALNKLGEEGWELVGVQAVGEQPYVIFKRPVDIGESAD